MCVQHRGPTAYPRQQFGLGRVLGEPLLDHVQRGNHTLQRRAQFMADARQELAFALERLLERFQLGPLDLALDLKGLGLLD